MELAAALAFFAIFAGGVTLAVGSAVGTTHRLKLDRALSDELTALVTQASTATWPVLLDGPDRVPAACESALEGWEGHSCVVILGRDVTVSWVSERGADTTGDQPRAYLDLSATGELAGRSRTVTQRVWAPTSAEVGT